MSPYRLRLLILTVGLGFPVAARALSHEVVRSGQLDTLIGTIHLAGTAHGGDRIHVSRGVYVAPAGGWKIRQPLEIFGDGPGQPFDGAVSSTWLRPAGDADSVLVIDISRYPASRNGASLENLSIHDLSIGRDAGCAPNRNSVGIAYRGPGGRNLVNLRLARVRVFHMGGDGIHLEGGDLGTGAIVGVSLDDCSASFNCGDGLEVSNATVLRILGGSYDHNAGKGAYLRACPGAEVNRTVFEENQADARGPGDAQLCLESAHGFSVTGGHFEGFASPKVGRRTAVGVVGCMGGYLGSSTFGCNDAVPGSKGVYLWHGNSRGIVIGPNSWSQVETLVEAQDDTTITSCVVMPQTVFATGGLASKLAIPEAADRGHLVLPSTASGSNVTAGIELPKLSGARRDGMSAASSGGTRREGLVVYNDTAKRLDFWDGTRWCEAVVFAPTTTAANAPPAGITLPTLATTTRDSVPASVRRAGTIVYSATDSLLDQWDGRRWRRIPALFPKDGTAESAPGGMLFPALTTSEIAALPARYRTYGALVFNKDEGKKKFQYWDGSGWQDVTR